MELRQLEHFVAVAEERSFTRAARRVHIVQSGLSGSVRALEKDLGTTLFLRTTRSVQLTEAGRALLVEAQRTLAAARAARNAVAAVDGLLRGTVSVGILQRFSSILDTPEILGRFHREHPGVQIRLAQWSSTSMMKAVHRGRLDLAVLGLGGPPPQGVTTTLLARDSMQLVLPLSHRLARRKEVALAALAGESFVDFRPDWSLRQLTDRVFEAAHIRRTTACEVNDVPTLLDLVAHGIGIALVPRAVSMYKADVRYVSPRPAAPTWDIAVAYRGAQPSNPAARALLKALLDRVVKVETASSRVWSDD